MKKSVSKKYKGILLIASIILFFGYNFLNFGPRLFNSPDATANFVFISSFADGGRIEVPHRTFYDDLSQFIHPRSTFADFGNVVLPVGFFGLVVLYGFIGKVIGASATVFITPVLAIFAAWALFGIWKKVFNERQAFFAALVYLLHPVVWYYSARSLLPNVPFFSLLIIGTYFLTARPFRKWYINDFAGSIIALLGLLIRPNEIIWILPVALVVLISYRKKIQIQQWAIWISISALFGALYIAINKFIYGTAQASYLVSNSLETSHWYDVLLPFGFHPTHIVKTGYVYFVEMYWWLVLPALIGLLFVWSVFIRNKLSKALQVYTLAFLVGSAVLFIYYGSQIDISYELKTIGVAYSRYWLPILVMLIPFILYAFDHLKFPKKKPFKYFNEIFVGIALLLGPQLVFSGIDGLSAVEKQISYIQDVRVDVLSRTTERDIIVTDREDKFFWPTRDVMVRFRDPAIPKAVSSALNKEFGVFYFTPTLSGDQEKEVLSYIEDYGLNLEFVEEYPSHILYKFIFK